MAGDAGGNMKKFLIGLFAAAVVPAYLFAANAIVKSVSGEANCLKAETQALVALKEGMVLAAPDEVRTGSDGSVLLVLDTGSEIKIGQTSKMKISDLSDTDTLLDLTLGELEAKVEKLKKNMSFKVRTPASVCAVRGTKFSVKVDNTGKTKITVFAGIVSAREISGIGEEIYIRPNQFLEVIPGVEPSSAVDLSFAPTTREVALTSAELMNEVKADMTKEEVQQAAAIEVKNAEYEQGKTMIDYFGNRVRIEEYIVRPQSDQFKFVALNERDNRYDYFTWLATFNTDLPADLSVANEIAFAKSDTEVWSAEPSYWVKQNDCAVSNTVDSVTWTKKRADYNQTCDVTEFKINGGGNETTMTITGSNYNADTKKWTYKLSDGSSFEIAEDKTSSDAYDKYSTNFPSIGNYSEEYYFIDDEGSLASRDDYNSNALAYNEELVFKADNFTGTDGKIDLVVEPAIFQQAGIR